MVGRPFRFLLLAEGLPDEIPTVRIPRAKLEEGAIDIVALLLEADLVKSKGEARRIIQQGGVKIDGIKMTNLTERLRLDEARTIQCGKRRFAKVELGD